ncbi:hypothetical protein ACTHRC_11580, partial [Neisseria sp. P0001.S009]|uniref:hypothetical protein n=1 Tax=Neisseria sp. P0001.S009 TaxID=3436653 RepID=UPI003F7DD51C
WVVVCDVPVLGMGFTSGMRVVPFGYVLVGLCANLFKIFGVVFFFNLEFAIVVLGYVGSAGLLFVGGQFESALLRSC